MDQHPANLLIHHSTIRSSYFTRILPCVDTGVLLRRNRHRAGNRVLRIPSESLLKGQARREIWGC